MRRKFSPAATLLLGPVTFLLGDIAGVGQTRVHTTSSSLNGVAVAPLSGSNLTDSLFPKNTELSNVRDEVVLLLTQSNATLQGRVIDQNGAVVDGAKIAARHDKTGVERIGESDNHGHYQIAALMGSHANPRRG
jgi:hypothetical protein